MFIQAEPVKIVNRMHFQQCAFLLELWGRKQRVASDEGEALLCNPMEGFGWMIFQRRNSPLNSNELRVANL